MLWLGFYSTYEELKLLGLFLCWACFYGFYSTYEELKLDDFPKELKNRIEFLQYLWGIETPEFYFYPVKLF